MPSHGNSLRSLQARRAASQRWGTSDRDEIARNYAAERLADYIKRTVDAAPPLTAEQRDRLALLLTGGGLDAAS
jgi:hypothetical protein